MLKISKTIVFLTISINALSQGTKLYSSKIDPILVSKAQSNGVSDFFVILKEQANVDAAYAFNTKEEKGKYVYDALTATAVRSQAGIISLLQQKGIAFQRFWVVNALLVKSADINIITQLAERSDVKEVIENAHYTYHHPVKEYEANKVMAIEWGITKTQTDAVWALGFKGQGVVIGAQDTGYDWAHPAIKGQYRGNANGTPDHNYNWHDAIHSAASTNPCGSNSMVPCDDDQHGTHTMGTMLGFDGGSNQIGMAPSAKWIGCRNMNAGLGELATYIECFQWFIAPTDLNNANPNTSKAPHVINNSWGCDASEGCNSSNYASMETVVNNVKAAGIVVVVSAGNDGSACSTITTPAAIYKNSFTVGSTTNTDGISSFSSRGPITVYGASMLGPDISAPGSNIRSCVPGGTYKSMSGTSMAGPHVAGLVALIISANPSLAGNVNLIESIIQNTAVKLSSTQTCGGVSGASIPNNTFGYGRINALAAVQSALNIGVSGNQAMQAGVSVFPNPSTGLLYIEYRNMHDSPCTLSLYALTGELVLSETWSAQMKLSHPINIQMLAEGMYCYRLESNQGTVYGRIVKTNE